MIISWVIAGKQCFCSLGDSRLLKTLRRLLSVEEEKFGELSFFPFCFLLDANYSSSPADKCKQLWLVQHDWDIRVDFNWCINLIPERWNAAGTPKPTGQTSAFFSSQTHTQKGGRSHSLSKRSGETFLCNAC